MPVDRRPSPKGAVGGHSAWPDRRHDNAVPRQDQHDDPDGETSPGDELHVNSIPGALERAVVLSAVSIDNLTSVLDKVGDERIGSKV